MLFICKLIKNNKGDQGSNTKLCMHTHKLTVNISNNKSKKFNFSIVRNKSIF